MNAAALLTAVLISAPALAATREECTRQFDPRTGQPGKDVIWVPTSDALVMRMLKLAAVSSFDLLYDLGAGDGKIAIAAARHFGARSVGVEYNPDFVRLAQCFVKAEGVDDRVRIVAGDLFETDFSAATVVTLYLLPELNMRLRPTLLAMKPGTRIVSHSFLMEDWEPDERSMSEDGHVYLWIVPANVAGTWVFRAVRGNDRFIVQLNQKFQRIDGSAGEHRRALIKARVKGERLQLLFPEGETLTRVEGAVAGERIEARVTRGGKTALYVGARD